MTQLLTFKRALLTSGWANDVSIEVDAQGNIANIEQDIGGQNVGCLLPGLSNLHSHAHQRAMAGFAERASSRNDSFWTWRKTMYQFLDAMQPHHLAAVASQLYLEMLLAGYTHVAEFQYLHHQANGKHYDNLAEMTLQTLHAAQAVGIGITSLPVHYQYSGFGAQEITSQQARFFNTPETFLRIVELIEKASAGNFNSNVGVAGHSLRATNKESFSQILGSLGARDMPIHMHVAEQLREVEDCEHFFGARPVDYCLDNFEVNANWCLVHATHMSDSETLRLASSGAVVGLCPTTEANLGDGFFNANAYLNAGGKLGIGSDSHISTSPIEELRWFEYGQRLLYESRNQLAGSTTASTGRNLLDISLQGGAQACGRSSGEIAVGKRADFIVLDLENPLLVCRDGDSIIDSWVFSGNTTSLSDVYVGGHHVVSNGRHQDQEKINNDFKVTMRELLQ